MGLYTQQDPIGIAGGLNLYGYANGDPINFSDPFGLCVEEDERDEADVCEWLVSELRRLDGDEFQTAANILDDLEIPVYLGRPNEHADLTSSFGRVRGQVTKAPFATCGPDGSCTRPDLRITLDMTQAVGDFFVTAVHETYHLNARGNLRNSQIRPYERVAVCSLPGNLQGLAPYWGGLRSCR